VNRRIITTASLSALLALGSLPGVIVAQDPEPQDEPTDTRTTMGTIVAVVEDGRTVYYLDAGDGSELILLMYGPSWFWGPLNPLDGLVGQEITVGGQLRDGMPNEHASDTAKEQAAKTPKIKVRSIGGEKRKGKPAWAGGPEAVGESHPGHAGWSKGQAAKAAKAQDKPEKPAKPGKP
jgi:hypothetical protein